MALRRRHVPIGIGVCVLLIAACTGSKPDYPLGQQGQGKDLGP